MKKILFTPGIGAVEALGSITRLLAIADEIRKKQEDCQMLFRAAGREAEYARTGAYEVVEGYKPEFDLSQMPSRTQYSVDSLSDVMRIKGLLSREYVQYTYKEEMELVEIFQPDLIVGEFDTVMPIVAKKRGIPYFSTGGTSNRKDFSCYGFSNRIENEKHYAESYNELLESLNLNPIESICELNQDYNDRNVLIPSIPELEDFEESDRYVYLGSIIPVSFVKRDFHFKKRRPLVYVYLSVGELKPDVYQKILVDTFSGSDFDVIVTGGGVPQFQADEKGDENVHFLNMVPSEQVLDMADIAIHHGGQNTTVQCIKHKVPSIIFPGKHFERYYNAQKAAEIGCAVNAGVEQFTKEYLLETCTNFVKKRIFRENLGKYSAKIKEYGGAKRAAEILLEYK